MERQVLDRFRDLEFDIASSTRAVKEAKDDLAAAKAALDGAYEALREYARELTDPEKTPLFEHVDTTTGEIGPADQDGGAEESR